MWTRNLCFACWFRMRVPKACRCWGFISVINSSTWWKQGDGEFEAGLNSTVKFQNLQQINGIRISQLSACNWTGIPSFPLLFPCSHLPTSLPIPHSFLTVFTLFLPQLLKCWYFGGILSCRYLVCLQNGLEVVETHNQTFKHSHRSPWIFCFSFNSLGDSYAINVQVTGIWEKEINHSLLELGEGRVRKSCLGGGVGGVWDGSKRMREPPSAGESGSSKPPQGDRKQSQWQPHSRRRHKCECDWHLQAALVLHILTSSTRPFLSPDE